MLAFSSDADAFRASTTRCVSSYGFVMLASYGRPLGVIGLDAADTCQAL